MILITYSHLYIVIYTFFQHMKNTNITKHANHAQKINKKPPGPFPLHWGAERDDFHKPSADRSKAIQTRKQGSSATACFSVYRLFCPGAVVICEKKSQMQQKAMARNCFLKQIQRLVQGFKSQDAQGQPPHILQDPVGFLSNISWAIDAGFRTA